MYSKYCTLEGFRCKAGTQAFGATWLLRLLTDAFVRRIRVGEGFRVSTGTLFPLLFEMCVKQPFRDKAAKQLGLRKRKERT